MADISPTTTTNVCFDHFVMSHRERSILQRRNDGRQDTCTFCTNPAHIRMTKDHR